MPGRGLFITGTDTGCGKTCISLALMRLLREQGRRVLGMKPVASGSRMTDQGLRNPDALGLQAAASGLVPYDQVNPYAFAPPIAPHIAALEAGVTMDLALIQARFQSLAEQADWVLVEGVGGWRVPLGPGLEVADLPAALDIPVLLVVGMRLGCLNHALLTVEGIQSRGTRLLGWVANPVEPDMPRLAENVASLQERIPAPLLGQVAFVPGEGEATIPGASLVGALAVLGE